MHLLLSATQTEESIYSYNWCRVSGFCISLCHKLGHKLLINAGRDRDSRLSGGVGRACLSDVLRLSKTGNDFLETHHELGNLKGSASELDCWVNDRHPLWVPLLQVPDMWK